MPLRNSCTYTIRVAYIFNESGDIHCCQFPRYLVIYGEARRQTYASTWLTNKAKSKLVKCLLWNYEMDSLVYWLRQFPPQSWTNDILPTPQNINLIEVDINIRLYTQDVLVSLKGMVTHLCVMIFGCLGKYMPFFASIVRHALEYTPLFFYYHHNCQESTCMHICIPENWSLMKGSGFLPIGRKIIHAHAVWLLVKLQAMEEILLKNLKCSCTRVPRKKKQSWPPIYAHADNKTLLINVVLIFFFEWICTYGCIKYWQSYYTDCVWTIII